MDACTKKVWFSLWDLAHYSLWTSEFCEGSYALTKNWEQGSRVHFLSPSGSGMYSDVVANTEFQHMSFGFDLEGEFDEIIPEKILNYHLDDNRKVNISFEEKEGKTLVVQKFEPETENTFELQLLGWQTILNHFKTYCET